MRRLAGRSGTKSAPRTDRPGKRLQQRRLGFETLEDRRFLDGGGLSGILFVDGDAPGVHDGSSWQNAFQRLEDALAMAAGGDEIRVAQGTYTPAGPGGDRYASFQIAAGLTVRGGYAGVRAANPDARDIGLYPTILSGDLNGDDGPDFLNNDENSYHVVTGGGENAVLDCLTITGGNANDAWPYPESFGGGLYEYAGTVSNCVIRANAAAEGGGLYRSMGQFIHCVIADNMAFERGGGASLDGESPTFTYCVFRGNTADTSGSDGRGGGIFTLDNAPNLIDCVLAGNVASAGGALYAMENYDSLMVNCVFAGNRALEEGAGLYSDGSGSPGAPLLSNCIFWANTTVGRTDETAQIAGVPPTINYSCVQGLTGDLGGAGNIGSDPQFVDADGPDNFFGTGDDDLHLLPGSPCINAGDNRAVPPTVTTDLDGSPRVFSGRVDIGAYESQSTPLPVVRYVDQNAMGMNNGTSWADAFSTLQDALAIAADGDEIRVAQGTYTPAEPGGDRYTSFQMVAGLTVRGGYAGVDAADPDARDIVLYPTILSGDLSGDDGPDFLNNDENSYHVVTGGGENAVLDGLTITGGNANDAWPYPESFGGGLYEYSGTVSNCVIRANAASEGGGLYRSSGQFIHCVIADNMAFRRGGGASLDGESPTFTYCVFRGNTADTSGPDGRGGGIFTLDNAPNLINCVLAGNVASAGGALYAMENYDSLMVNCVFAGNRALEEGAGLYSDGSGSPGAPLLSNCIFWANTTVGRTDETAQISGVPPTINYSCVQGLTGDLGGAGNIGSDPQFVDADGPDNLFGTGDDDLHLLPGSPCVDAGDNLDVPPTLTADLDGNPRVFSDHVDIGAYESSYVALNINGTADPDDFTLGLTVDRSSIRIISPGGSYIYAIGAITSLRFTGGMGGDRLTVDFTNGNPIPMGGITFNAGPDGEPDDSLVVQGTAGSDSVVMSGNQVTVNGSVITANGVEFFGFDLGEAGSGTLGDASGLYKTGPGTLVLSGANTYAGDTTVLGGKLIVTGGEALPGTTSLVINGGNVVLDSGLNQAVKVSGLRLNLGNRSASPSRATNDVSAATKTTTPTAPLAAAIVPVAVETSILPAVPPDTPATEVETQSRLSLRESSATLAERKATLAHITHPKFHKQPARPRWLAMNAVARPAKAAVSTRALVPLAVSPQKGKAHDVALQAVIAPSAVTDLAWRRVASRVQSRVHVSQGTIKSTVYFS